MLLHEKSDVNINSRKSVRTIRNIERRPAPFPIAWTQHVDDGVIDLDLIENPRHRRSNVAGGLARNVVHPMIVGLTGDIGSPRDRAATAGSNATIRTLTM